MTGPLTENNPYPRVVILSNNCDYRPVGQFGGSKCNHIIFALTLPRLLKLGDENRRKLK